MTDPSRHIEVDVARTRLQRRFFETFAFDSSAELLAAIDGIDVDLSSLARSHDVRKLLADGWVYWFLFAKGYLQYTQAGDVEVGNVYLDYLTRYYLGHGHNPAMRGDLEHLETAKVRVVQRYRDLDQLRLIATGETTDALTPIQVTVSSPAPPHPYHFYPVNSDEPELVRAINGWHRMCSAALAGVETLACEVIDERLVEHVIDGVIEHQAVVDDRLIISGWWLHSTDPVYNYELRVGPRTAAVGTPIQRPDIQKAFPDVPHALQSGFRIEYALEPGDAGRELSLVALQDIIPVGVLRSHANA